MKIAALYFPLPSLALTRRGVVNACRPTLPLMLVDRPPLLRPLSAATAPPVADGLHVLQSGSVSCAIGEPGEHGFRHYFDLCVPFPLCVAFFGEVV